MQRRSDTLCIKFKVAGVHKGLTLDCKGGVMSPEKRTLLGNRTDAEEEECRGQNCRVDGKNAAKHRKCLVKVKRDVARHSSSVLSPHSVANAVSLPLSASILDPRQDLLEPRQDSAGDKAAAAAVMP